MTWLIVGLGVALALAGDLALDEDRRARALGWLRIGGAEPDVVINRYGRKLAPVDCEIGALNASLSRMQRPLTRRAPTCRPLPSSAQRAELPGPPPSGPPVPLA